MAAALCIGAEAFRAATEAEWSGCGPLHWRSRDELIVQFTVSFVSEHGEPLLSVAKNAALFAVWREGGATPEDAIEWAREDLHLEVDRSILVVGLGLDPAALEWLGVSSGGDAEPLLTLARSSEGYAVVRVRRRPPLSRAPAERLSLSSPAPRHSRA